MGAAFLITLREGLEAVLIVTIVMAYLRQLDRRDQFLPVMLGTLAGVAISVAVGVGVYVAIGELEGRAELYVGAATSLIAASVLTWMIFWMRRQARSMGGELRGQVDNALATGAMLGIVILVFVGVLREGLETALFMLTVILDNSATSAAVGGFAGLATATAIGYSIYRGSHFINLRLFFQITGGFVIVFAAGLFAKGIFQLQTLNVFNSLYFPVWDLTSNPVLGHGQFAAFMKGIFGWSARPSIEQVAIWAGYILIAGWFFYFGALPRSVTSRIDDARNSIASFLAAPTTSQVVTELERPES
jgi:high-affinity iron transporter